MPALGVDNTWLSAGAIFEEAGLKPDQKLVGSVSKTLSFRKSKA